MHSNSLYERIPITSIVFVSSQTAFPSSMTFIFEYSQLPLKHFHTNLKKNSFNSYSCKSIQLFSFHHKKLCPHPCHANLISYFIIEYSLFPLKLFILPSQTNLKITSIFLLIHFNSLYERIPFTSIVFFSSQTAFSPSMTFHHYFLFHYWIQSDFT